MFFTANAISPGYWVVFLAAALEFLGLPAPGGILLAACAATAAQHSLDLASLILSGALGAAAGDIPWYFVGRSGGGRLLRLYCRFTLGSRTCVAHTESFFHRFGILSLVFSKFFPGVRLFAPPMAGLARYTLSEFLVLDLLGAILWATFFALAGRVFGPRFALAISGQTIWLLTIAPFVLFLLVRVVKRVVRGPAEDVLPLRFDGPRSVVRTSKV